MPQSLSARLPTSRIHESIATLVGYPALRNKLLITTSTSHIEARTCELYSPAATWGTCRLVVDLIDWAICGFSRATLDVNSGELHFLAIQIFRPQK